MPIPPTSALRSIMHRPIALIVNGRTGDPRLCSRGTGARAHGRAGARAQRRRTIILTFTIVSGGIAGLLTSASAQEESPFGTEQNLAYAETLWSRLVEASLAGENAVNTVPYEGTAPHGLILETLYRDLEVDGHTGLAVVKRNYGPEGVSVEDVQRDRRKHMGSITVMFQREEGYDPQNQNWYWAKYLADGSLDQNEAGLQLAGRVAKGADQGCIACHSAAPGDDYLYTFDLQE